MVRLVSLSVSCLSPKWVLYYLSGASFISKLDVQFIIDTIQITDLAPKYGLSTIPKWHIWLSVLRYHKISLLRSNPRNCQGKNSLGFLAFRICLTRTIPGRLPKKFCLSNFKKMATSWSKLSMVDSFREWFQFPWNCT